MYNPSAVLFTGIRNAFPRSWFPWDDYFLRMAEADMRRLRAEEPAMKSFFIRKAPFSGSYALLGGITAALREIDELRFDEPEFQVGMREMGYTAETCQWFKKKQRLKVDIYASPEGQVIYPQEPIITARGDLADIRLVEGIITECVNFSTLSLTKWRRLVDVASPCRVYDMSRRRAQHSLKSSLYAMLAGCDATSNAEIRRFFDVPIFGTMGHEWVQSFGNVRLAFDEWIAAEPERPIGLVDTKQCLEHDFPAWLNAVYNARELVQSKAKFWGWRNDSGDLVRLTCQQYEMFLEHRLSDYEWFRNNLRVFLTNDLDEYAVSSMLRQFAEMRNISPSDIPNDPLLNAIGWAAGTKPGTCDDQPSLGGVAKLTEISGNACIKLAFDADGRSGMKTSIPGANFSAQAVTPDGEVKCVVIYPMRKYHIMGDKLVDPYEHEVVNEVVHPDNPGIRIDIRDCVVSRRQELLYDSTLSSPASRFKQGVTTDTWRAIRARIDSEVCSLPKSMRRLENPHLVPVMFTPDLYELRSRMIKEGVLRSDYLKKEV